MSTQDERILEYLLAGRSLTPLDALDMFGCFRLGARIFDLKRKGYNIKSKMVKVGRKWVARYRMETE